MMYLYSSGYRTQYAHTIYRTLGYPEGMLNWHYYRCTGENSHVCTAANNQLQKVKQGEEVIIVIVDRNSTGYRYYPVRKATLVSYKYENNYVNIYVKLGDFIFPKNIEKTEEELKNNCTNLPKLNVTPECTNDGSYITFGESIINNAENMCNFFMQSKDGMEVWEKITECIYNISTLHIENNSRILNPFFVKFDVVDDKGNPVKLYEKNLESYYLISPQKTYKLKIYGKNYIAKESKNKKVKLMIQKNEDINTRRLVDFTIEAGENSYELEFTEENKKSCKVSLEVSDANDFCGLQTQISFKYKKKIIKTAVLCTVFSIIYIFASFLVKRNEDIDAKTMCDIITYIREHIKDLIFYALQIGSIIGITCANDGKKLF